MKIWKMVGCVALLCVIICGCAVLGQSNKVAAKTEEPEEPSEESGGAVPPEQQDSTATVTKTYSEGLAFRSNGDGTCAVAGLGSCTAACVLIPPQSPEGDRVTEILPFAFSGTIVGAIEIPDTIVTVSAASFSGCERLAYVRVAAENTALLEHDGVLYTASGSTLLYCPGGRASREVHLHPSLQRIAAGAFADCGSLTAVYFPGSTSRWHSLIIGDGNEVLYRAALQFNTN